MAGVSPYRPGLVPLKVDETLQRARSLLAGTREDLDAAPLTVAVYEAWIAHLEALKARQERGPNLVLERFLENPVEVLSDPEQWPTADDLSEGADLLADAYRRWLRCRAKQAGEPWESVQEYRMVRHGDPYGRALHWLTRHAAAPFIVGTACPELEAGFPAAAARELMPLQSSEYAAVVIPVGDLGGAFLGMSKPTRERYMSCGEWFEVSDGSEPSGWRPDGRRVEVVPVPKRSISKETQKSLRRWWRGVNGLPARGRQPGPEFWNAARILDALIAYVSENEAAPPSRDAFVRWAYEREGAWLNASSVGVVGHRWSRELRTPFPELADAVGNPKADVWVVEEDSN